VFVAGMLNGAYSVGTPDATTYVSTPIHSSTLTAQSSRRRDPKPQPECAHCHRDPDGYRLLYSFPVHHRNRQSNQIFLGRNCADDIQMYAINDYDALFTSPFPIAEIYRQATGSSGGTIGLLCLLLFCIGTCLVGVYITAGRTLWALARDGATPFPRVIGKISPRQGMPLYATLSCGCLITVLGW
jgi:choline transport protein